MTTYAQLAESDNDYKTLGISRTGIAQFEDGMRTTGEQGNYEWWYFDAHLEDGASLVIVFYTKPFLEGLGDLAPFISIQLERPRQEKKEWEMHFDTEKFRASRRKCDVAIGSNFFRGDLHEYAIHVENDDINLDVNLVGQIPAWRPKTGHIYFGEHDEYLFAWLPSVPQGKVQIEGVVLGEKIVQAGIGYHDHNWGNISMMKIINNWYWGRAKAGEFSIVASYITAEKKYHNAIIPIFLLAKNGQIITDDTTRVTFSLEDVHTNEKTGKPVADKVIYTWTDGDESYKVSYLRDQTIVEAPFIDRIKGPKRFLAKLAHVDGAYHRFTGNVTLEHRKGGKLIETASDPGIWELMYFGHVEP